MRSSFDRTLCLALCVFAALAQQSFCQSLTSNGDVATASPVTFSSQPSGSQTSRSLRFELCNGFANQRIALVFGILFAHILGRSAVLPHALVNGAQTADDWNLGDLSGLAPLSEIYDVEFLLQSLKQSGISAILPEHAPPLHQYHAIKLSDAPAGEMLQWLATFADQDHLQLDCTLFRLPSEEVVTQQWHFWAVIDALRPSQALNALVQSGVNKMRAHSSSSSSNFSFVHLRIESDWLSHCQRWSHIQDGVVRDNCFNTTLSLAEHFRGKTVDQDSPLYVASYWKEASTSLVKKVLIDLISGGYHVVTDAFLFPEHNTSSSSRSELGREQVACIDYYMALAADKFIGNSVSSFSAMIILERQRQGAWASYYNGGNVPLAAVLPLYQLPWVFTYNSWSSPYDYMLKAAVRSGLDHGHGRLKPYCLFAGSRSAPIIKWLEGHGITIIHEAPKWADRMRAMLTASQTNNIEHSHLYANADMQIGTWQRIDIPVLPVLSQYEYVLFSDADIFFRKPLMLDAFNLPLPGTIGMASEAFDHFPYNAGIMLMHLPALRSSYDRFLDFIFNNANGLFFPGYGPGDQGAINQFYEHQIKDTKLTQEFNAKPYHNFLSTSYIVHFHGPKPSDYLDFIKSGNCAFGWLCKEGMDHAVCEYGLEWAKYVQDEAIGQEMHFMCSMISNNTQPVDNTQTVDSVVDMQL